MKIEESLKVLTDKGTKQKIGCYKFYQTEMNRELAVHPNIDLKDRTSVSDVSTGLKLFDLHKVFEKVGSSDIDEKMTWFINHYTLEEILEEFKKYEGEEKK